jgi:deoxyadenosine/deoxycytidine kinase
VKRYFVAIAGNIGVGKSTLTARAARKLGWDPVFEVAEENPYMADFYQDMPRWSFHSQTFFLSQQLQRHYEMLQTKGSVLQDRAIYEGVEIFGKNLYRQGIMSAPDWQTYHGLYKNVVKLLQPPDLLVYLTASIPTLLNRIAQRGRDYESSISSEYLQALNNLYDEWVTDFRLCPVLRVETDHQDYPHSDEDLDQIIKLIQNRLNSGQ